MLCKLAGNLTKRPNIQWLKNTLEFIFCIISYCNCKKLNSIGLVSSSAVPDTGGWIQVSCPGLRIFLPAAVRRTTRGAHKVSFSESDPTSRPLPLHGCYLSPVAVFGTERLGNSVVLWATCTLLTFHYYGEAEANCYWELTNLRPEAHFRSRGAS